MSIAARPNSTTSQRFLQPLQSGISFLHRFWWHSKAYGVIFGVMLLTLLSLALLYVASQYRRLTKTHQNYGETTLEPAKLQSVSISSLHDNESF